MEKLVCYYHQNCFDGIAAAWAVDKKYKGSIEIELVPAQYGNKTLETSIMQDCFENANINYHYVIVDFSFPRELMIQMANKAKSILVLDHHKTAQANCEGLDFCKFDMDQSGAGLAWRTFFPGEPVPNLIQYIEDRDLWRFNLKFSNFVNAYIQSFPMRLEEYDRIHMVLDNNTGFEIAISAGEAIERYKSSMVDAMIGNASIGMVGGHPVPLVNATMLFSEIGHALCKKFPEYPFAASFFVRKDGKTVYSLRSIGDFDVSEVAKANGGGGHKNAAGFEVSF